MDQTAALAREFERESHRIDQLIWDAMALRAGEAALFCGYANNVDWIKRAIAIGVDVTVIANDSLAQSEFKGVPIKIIRGSTSILPARDASFDVTVAFHYLHEVDPFFHANIVSELARVGKRCVIVEPAPPSDPLGLRIAALYSRAKQGLGQFETYHHIDYWRKLLAIVKPDVTYAEFNFMRRPPRAAIRETVALIIDTMAAEDTPLPYLDELRALAKRPDAQLLPQARYVIVGTADGLLRNAGAGTMYRDGASAEATVSPFAPTPAPPPRVYSRPDTEPEFPTIEPSPMRTGQPVTAASQVARNAFGLPAADSKPRPTAVPAVKSVPTVKEDDGEPAFGVTGGAPADPATEFGWEWEPPGGGS